MDPPFFPFFFLFFFLITSSSSASTLKQPSSIDARRVLLYDNGTVSVPTSTYVISFATSFSSVPVFVFGVNEYKLNDQFFYQNMDIYQSGLNNVQVWISVVPTGATNVRLLSISLMAAVNPAISSQWHVYSYASNISTSSGDRYNLAYYGRTFTSTSVLALPLLTSFYIQSNIYFMINTTATVVSTTTYEVRIQTTSDCFVKTVKFYVLFCQTDTLSNNEYYYRGGKEVIMSSDVNALSWNTQINYYNQTVFILGIRTFGGFTSGTNCQWGWSVTNVTNDIATLLINKKRLQYLYFSFLQIGYQGQPTTAPSSPSQGSSFIGIIAALIAVIVIVSASVYLFLRCYWWKRHAYKPPQSTNFRQMPSLSL